MKGGAPWRRARAIPGAKAILQAPACKPMLLPHSWTNHKALTVTPSPRRHTGARLMSRASSPSAFETHSILSDSSLVQLLFCVVTKKPPLSLGRPLLAMQVAGHMTSRVSCPFPPRVLRSRHAAPSCSPPVFYQATGRRSLHCGHTQPRLSLTRVLHTPVSQPNRKGALSAGSRAGSCPDGRRALVLLTLRAYGCSEHVQVRRPCLPREGAKPLFCDTLTQDRVGIV